MGASKSVPQKSLHEFTVKDSKGKDVDLSIYKGKVLLVVNVASKWTWIQGRRLAVLKNARDSTSWKMKTLHKEKPSELRFEVLAFPCNQFLRQEPGTSVDAEEFACTRYKAEYPVFQKVRVNGPRATPMYKFLKASKSGFFGSSIKWNFTKFLVDKEGRVISRYGTTAKPLSFEADIQKALSNN